MSRSDLREAFLAHYATPQKDPKDAEDAGDGVLFGTCPSCGGLATLTEADQIECACPDAKRAELALLGWYQRHWEVRPAADRRDLFDRPVDRALECVRKLCSEYGLDAPFRWLPGSGDDPDAWLCRCPLHPSSGQSLVLRDRGWNEPGLYCRLGCPTWAIREALIPDPEREATAQARAAVLVWGQRYRKRAA